MAKKSFWQRGEDYAEKDRRELIEQIKSSEGHSTRPPLPGQTMPERNGLPGCAGNQKSASLSTARNWFVETHHQVV